MGGAKRSRVGGVIRRDAEIVDAPCYARAFGEMTRCMFVTRRACTAEREVDHCATHQRGGERVFGFQRVPGGRQQLVKIAVQFLRAGERQLARTLEVRPVDEEAERLVDVAVGERMRKGALLSLEVLEVGHRAQVSA